MQLTQRQNEIIIGSLLGDGTIWTNFKDPLMKFQLNQSKYDNHECDKKNYILWYAKEFINIGCSLRLKKYSKTGLASNNGEEYEKYVFTTLCDSYWNEVETKWYVPRLDHVFFKRRKIVPNLIKLTPLTLTIWHMDDGYANSIDANIELNTQGFTRDEINFLIEKLKIDLDINSHEKKAQKENQYKIFIGRKDYFKFMKLVKSNVEWDCFKYKTDISTYDKIEHKGENHSNCKLTEKQIDEIFELRNQGTKQKEIALKYNVSQANISSILNGKKRGREVLNVRVLQRMNEDQKLQIEKGIEQGVSQCSLARTLGVSQSTISKFLKNKG